MKVLVPTDGSEQAMKAVQKALELAEKSGAEVTLMTVAPFAPDILDEMTPRTQERLEAEAAAILNQAKELFEKKGLKVNTVLEAGLVPANNILRLAEEGKFDCIIMGSTGRTGLARILMGSTAAKVVAHAPCEVTIVR
jgi:nucleotide-binding universal stress UspA family protein|uniref:Universal stress protein n=1 Tax=Desulfobacca acetoxidans TaxID=60893 RepID=A0A7C3WU65_9BACT